ncbi:MAG: hypothetical protein J6Z13_03160, partial [Clostridia bacterium]|nr:hypothetical protein [Clostridia bacterium]
MHNRVSNKKTTSLLILYAILIIAALAVIPVIASASGTPAAGGEIENFGYQTLTGADVKNDEETDLRFLFSIDNLDYTAVGFVFSTSDDPVKVESPTRNYTATTKVYRSVTANGNEIKAPIGRFWVAVKLSDIPHASFATYIYIRPFVQDGSGTRYGETKRINVCEALGHVHEIKNPTGTATLLSAGTRCGDCDACGLTGIVEEDVRAAVADSLHSAQKFLKGSSDASEFDRYVYVNNTPTGSQKYYPDAENNYEGRDFYFEIDMLWNETMLNSIQNKFQLCFYKGSSIPLFYFTPKDYANRQSGDIAGDKGDNPWSGGFDWTNGKDTLEGPAGGWGMLFDRYPNLNRSGEEQDWGWHRIGVRVHEDAHANGNTVTYSGVFYLYIDGVQRWKVDLNTSTLKSKSALLFTMDPDGTYHANTADFYFDFWATDLDQSTSEVHMVTTNPTSAAVIPSQFSAGVVPVSDPVPSKFVLKNDTAVDARVWFMAEHDHVWDGNEVLTREATVLQAGKKAEHCKLCGAEKPTGTSVTFAPTVYESTNGTFGVDDYVPGYGLSKSLSSIRGDETFYPRTGHAAKNLYFEYSLLWNSTLQNWDDATESSEMKVITFYKSGNHKEFYLLYAIDHATLPHTTGDCPYANHFDFSSYHEYNSTGVVNGVYDNDNGTPGYQAGYDTPPLVSSSPSISYGWHRIGVLVHLEASGSDATVSYLGWSALYID